MLVAISGSQGSGKTTILDKLKQQGFETVERKTSRSIMSEWGVTLQEVNDNPDLTIKFQDEIIRRKYLDEKIAVDSPNIWFTERTYADLFTYALISLGKDNQFSEWLDSYYRECMRLQQTYSLVYYLKAGHFQIVHDGVRGSSPHYSRMVDLTMFDFTEQMTLAQRINVVNTPNIDQRVSIIAIQATSKINEQKQRTDDGK